MHIRSRSVFGRIITSVFHIRFIRRREIRAAAHKVGKSVRKKIKNFTARISRCVGFIEFEEFFVVKKIGQFAAHIVFVTFRKFGIRLFIFVKERFPIVFDFRAFFFIYGKGVFHLFGNGKRGIIVSEVFAKPFNAVRAERRAVSRFAAGFGRAVADYGTDNY